MIRFAVIVSMLFLSSCASVDLTKRGLHYQEKSPQIKSIAVMPVDFKMFQISAGGIQEEMDEWSAAAKKLISDDLKQELAGRIQEIKFIDDKSMKAINYELWVSQKALFEAVASSIVNHAYPGPNAFDYKINNFDYSLGSKIQSFSQLTGADALLFIQGYDSERTGGRMFMEIMQGAVFGVYYNYFSVLNMGLVDAKTGEVLWFKVKNVVDDMNFTNPMQVEKTIKWFAQDFLK